MDAISVMAVGLVGDVGCGLVGVENGCVDGDGIGVVYGCDLCIVGGVEVSGVECWSSVMAGGIGED